jgi:conjugative transfer pilus assembly protein TraH
MSGAVSLMATSVICASIVMSEPVYAGWWQEFYDENTAGVNITHNQRIQAGNMTAYGGGSITWRMKRPEFPALINATRPRFNVGCNGIDIYLGSFSFIDKDEFIEALRNSGQQALAGLFLGAVKAMSPLIGGIIEYLMGIINAVNNFGRDACGMGEKIGYAAGTGLMKAAGLNAANDGEYPDFSGAMKEYFVDGIYTAVVDGAKKLYGQTFAKDKPLKDLVKDGCHMPHCNIVYFALAKKYMDESAFADIDEFRRYAEMSLSIVGYHTTVPPWDHSEDLKFESFQPDLTVEKLAGIGDELGSAQVRYKALSCQDDKNTCNPPKSWESITPTYFKAFESAYQSIYDAVVERRDVSLSDEQSRLLVRTNIPIWRLASMEATPGVFASVAKAHKNEFIEAAALEAALMFITGRANEVRLALTSIKAETTAKDETRDKAEEAFKAINENIQNINRESQEYILKTSKNGKNAQAFFQIIAEVERLVYGSLNLAMAENMRFSTGRY